MAGYWVPCLKNVYQSFAMSEIDWSERRIARITTVGAHVAQT